VSLSTDGVCNAAPGESLTKELPGLFMDSGCVFEPVSWRLVADTLVQSGTVELIARALVEGSCTSYPSYSDSIGGRASFTLSTVDWDVVTVDASGGASFDCIQDALDAVPDGKTIEVLPGVYRGERNRNLSTGGKDIVLRSSDGPASTIIDCQGRGRGFVFDRGEGRGTIIDGFTVKRGHAPERGVGGGCLVDGASPTVRNIVFSSCCASDAGGGLCCADGASPLLEGCVFWGNEAGVRGGAVAALDGSSPELVGCTAALNASPGCGGVYCSASSPLITETIIYGSLEGDAVSCEQGASPVVTFSCLFGNAGGDRLPAQCGAEDVLFADPLLCAPELGDLTLQICSPCVGGSPTGGNIGACETRCPCEELAALPGVFALHAPHPSPSGNVTRFTVDLPPDAGRVRLSVYSAEGRLVRTLVDRELGPGRRSFTWQGEDETGRRVASGVYFAVCVCGGRSDSRKLVLVR
jgi:hypothetical protein